MLEKIIIIDYGSQYTQLIGRKVRELNVYCEIYPFNNPPDHSGDVAGIILSGSPFSVHGDGAPAGSDEYLKWNVPVLGVCYGAQLLVHEHGGRVEPSNIREYGRANLIGGDFENPLLRGLRAGSQVWMSHGDTISALPQGTKSIAHTTDVANAAFQLEGKPVWGIQFHPEVTHTEQGNLLLENFLKGICRCKADWTSENFIEATVSALRESIGTAEVVMALSGGVDSTVAAVLLQQAIGEQLTCIFVDNGLLRKGEYEAVLEGYKDLSLRVRGINAQQLFYDRLAGVDDPETKRKAIGRAFIDVFDEAVGELPNVSFLGQGTIYPDVIESLSVKGPSATIKSHHNVGGLPKEMRLKVIEPLSTLFKDEVRRVGAALGIPKAILQRHPFPGPGLAIRILGDVTIEKVRLLQEADAIYINALKADGLYDQIWQAGAILLNSRSVGVMGDDRTYEQVIALRAVHSHDGMTADWVHLPYDFLAKISSRIINQVKGVNRVVYDISSKPPATIEWE